jgi:DNA mismatch repair ATPase MutS
MLFLIDEIFRGTNSKDRTDGAQIVIRNLLLPWVIGMMSTHDYQLCETMKNEPEIRFYFFSEKYDERGIHFDYRLSPGISTAANARYLMKLVGIE